MNLLKRFLGIVFLIKICNSIIFFVYRNIEEGKFCEGFFIFVVGLLDLKSSFFYR